MGTAEGILCSLLTKGTMQQRWGGAGGGAGEGRRQTYHDYRHPKSARASYPGQDIELLFRCKE